jgi:hypothetical protein
MDASEFLSPYFIAAFKAVTSSTAENTRIMCFVVMLYFTSAAALSTTGNTKPKITATKKAKTNPCVAENNLCINKLY